MTRAALETAYCFFHQKQRVYQYSTLDWQLDDIECAISAYVDTMDHELYALLSDGRPDFLLRHDLFPKHLLEAVEKMESMMGES